MKKRFAVILAAGQGTRMKSKLYKVLHPILGRPMIQHVVGSLEQLQLDQLITIVGHGAEEVMKIVGERSEFAIQEEQLGTAHAVMQAEENLTNKRGTTIIVCGDTPLITVETYKKLFEYHEGKNAKATILTAKIADPTGYGRIVRNEAGEVEKIVEHKDATDEEKLIDEVNTGTYCFDNEALFQALKQVSNDNAQAEYYLTDVIEILKRQGETVAAYTTDNHEETIGINDRVALARAENLLKLRINEMHLRNGVTIVDPNTTYIGPDVTIEQDVIIYPGTILSGATHIATNAKIGPYSEIENSVIGSNSVIRQSVVINSKIGTNTNVGPFAHIRPESVVENDVRVGNFVEIKKSTVGSKTSIAHLSYIGDAEIGEQVNVGCGAITVNYDGKEKHKTTIESNTFIGCNSNLIAPVTVKEGSYVAAGSTITDDVPNDTLAIGRARQTNKEGYYTTKFKK